MLKFTKNMLAIFSFISLSNISVAKLTISIMPAENLQINLESANYYHNYLTTIYIFIQII